MKTVIIKRDDYKSESFEIGKYVGCKSVNPQGQFYAELPNQPVSFLAKTAKEAERMVMEIVDLKDNGMDIYEARDKVCGL